MRDPRTMKVRLLRSRSGAVGLINESDFDPALHAPFSDEPQPAEDAPAEIRPGNRDQRGRDFRRR